jgi:M6 family metalloprotease-like protein
MLSESSGESIVGLTILVQFPDDPETAWTDPTNFPTTAAKIERFCNEIGYADDGNTGSVRDYFSDQSQGALSYTQLVTPIITLPYPRNYYNYADYPDNTALSSVAKAGRALISDAVDALKATGFDFSAATLDSGDKVVATNILFAGGTSGVWECRLMAARLFASSQDQCRDPGKPH